MLIDRDYMKDHVRSNTQIIVLHAPSKFATYTATQWANVLIFILAVFLIGFILSRVVR